MRKIVALLLTLTLVSRASHIHNPSGGQCLGGLIHPPTSGAVSYAAVPDPNPAPTVSSVSPTAGALAGGTSLTINGTGFLTGITSTVGGTACTSPNRLSALQMSCTLPAKSAGTYAVAVTNTDGQSASLSNAYTYQAAPTVSSVSPSTGTTAGGEAVTITGTGFLSGATAALGGVTCTSPNVTNSTTLTCTTGARAAATVNAVVTNTDGQSGTGTNAFTYEAPFTPASLSGLKLWVKADQISASDGDALSTWSDQSGNGYDLSSSLTLRPLYKTNIKNSLPVVRFDGSNDLMDTSTNMGNILSTTAFSFWAVVNQKAFPSTDPTSYFNNEAIWTEKNNGNVTLCGFTNAGVKFGFENYGGGEHLTRTAVANTWYVIHVRHESGTIYMSVNNGTETSIASGNSAYGANVLRVGSRYDGAASTEMDVGEMVFSNAAEGSTNRDNMQTYLNNKWAVY